MLFNSEDLKALKKANERFKKKCGYDQKFRRLDSLLSDLGIKTEMGSEKLPYNVNPAGYLSEGLEKLLATDLNSGGIRFLRERKRQKAKRIATQLTIVFLKECLVLAPDDDNNIEQDISVSHYVFVSLSSMLILAAATFEIGDGLATVLQLLGLSPASFWIIFFTLLIVGLLAYYSFEIVEFYRRIGWHHTASDYDDLLAILKILAFRTKENDSTQALSQEGITLISQFGSVTKKIINLIPESKKSMANQLRNESHLEQIGQSVFITACFFTLLVTLIEGCVYFFLGQSFLGILGISLSSSAFVATLSFALGVTSAIGIMIWTAAVNYDSILSFFTNYFQSEIAQVANILEHQARIDSFLKTNFMREVPVQQQNAQRQTNLMRSFSCPDRLSQSTTPFHSV